MMKIFNALLFTFLGTFVFGQIQHGGQPISLHNQTLIGQVPIFETPITNIEALRQEDEVLDEIKDIPWRYGYIHYVDVSLSDGVFELLSDGSRLWRMKIKSKNAQTLNLTFDKFKLAEGAKLFLYTNNYEQVLGAFTHENNKDHGFLTTTLVRGDELTIELYEPANTIGNNVLHLQRIVHGYRAYDFEKKDIGDSGSCNNNVICSVGDNWRDQIRSVGILLQQNNLSAGFCTGAMINNTCQDAKPYFLTANHCNADNPTSVVGFNFESTSCNTNKGPYLNQTISGVILRASNAGSDMMLLELSSDPPPAYNVFYSGWDRSGNTTQGQVGIHHPAGDLKKISFDMQAAIYDTYSNAQCWRVLNWEDGTTEGGSSGSPLYNLDGNIIGQLFGGTASCQNNIDDYYGRFDISWDNGSNPGDELKTWLDPCGTNATVLNGYDPNAIVLNEDALLNFSNRPQDDFCGNKIAQALVIRNRGVQNLTAVEISYGVNGVFSTYNWTGLLTSNQFETIPFDSLVLSNGVTNYEAYIVSTNLTLDENLSNDTVSFDINVVNGVNVVINLRTNFAAEENRIEILDATGEIVAFEDNFDDNASASFTYCLPQGNYCIRLIDDGGNGLSPTFFFDQGNYQLIVDGEEVFNGDDVEDLYEFCIQGTGILNLRSDLDFNVFPNPSSGLFQIQAAEKMERIEIVDAIEKLVYMQELDGENALIDASSLNMGMYWIKIYSEKGTGLSKILLK